jgi:DNA processing protein
VEVSVTPPSDPIRLARVALAFVAQNGSTWIHQTVRAHGPEAALARLLAGEEPAFDSAKYDNLRKRTEGLLRKTQKLGARLVIPEEDDWPAQLDDLARINDDQSVPNPPPLCLWVLGDAPLAGLLERSVAVIGARRPTAYGIHIASGMGCGLAQESWTVVSEGAHGIDAASHRGALSADGPNVVFLSGGVGYCYPPDHEPLFERIREKGLLVSEWPPGSRAFRVKFAKTRRLIAAATCGTVVVEASTTSEAMQTLGHALRLKRPAMAVPGPVTSPMSSGCLKILRDHPQARLVTGPAEVVEDVERQRLVHLNSGGKKG